MHSPVFCCNLQTRVLFAAHCKHVRFPAAKRTGYHVSSHIITSYVLKRNRKQANPKESRALFGVWAGRTGLKMPFFLNASLERHSCKSGSISPLEIIPPGHFQQIRMHFSNGNHPSRKFSVDQDAFPAGNHPSRTFPANQDAFLRWESSLQDILQ